MPSRSTRQAIWNTQLLLLLARYKELDANLSQVSVTIHLIINIYLTDGCMGVRSSLITLIRDWRMG